MSKQKPSKLALFHQEICISNAPGSRRAVLLSFENQLDGPIGRSKRETQMRKFIAAMLATAVLLTVSTSFSSTSSGHQTSPSAPAQDTSDNTLRAFPMCAFRHVHIGKVLDLGRMHVLHIGCN